MLIFFVNFSFDFSATLGFKDGGKRLSSLTGGLGADFFIICRTTFGLFKSCLIGLTGSMGFGPPGSGVNGLARVGRSGSTLAGLLTDNLVRSIAFLTLTFPVDSVSIAGKDNWLSKTGLSLNITVLNDLI